MSLKYSVKIVLLLTVVFLYTSLHLINLKSVKKQIVKAINENNNLKLLVNGDISIQLLPSPSIILNDIVFLYANTKVIKSHSITISYRFMDLLTEGVKSPYSIQLRNITCSFEHIKEVLTKKIRADLSGRDADIVPILNYINIFFFEKNYIRFHSIKIDKRMMEIKETTFISYSLELINDISKKNKNVEIYIKNLIKKDNMNQFFITVSTNGINLSIVGSANFLLNDLKFIGNFKIDWVDVIREPSLNKAEYIKNVNLEGDISIINNVIQIKNIKFSDNYADIISSSIVIDYTILPAEVTLDIKFSVLNIDLMFDIKNLLINYSSIASASKVIKKILAIHISPHLFSAFTIFLNIEATSIIFHSEEINNFVFNADLANNDIYVNSIMFNIKDIGKFSMYGVTNTDKVRKKFKGNVQSSIKLNERFNRLLRLNLDENVLQESKALLFRSDISFTEHRIKFTNIKTMFGDLLIAGRYTIMKDGNNKINVASSIKFNNLDLDRIEISKTLNSILFLLINYYNKKVETQSFAAIANSSEWLRYFPINLNGEITIDFCKIKGISLNDIVISLEVDHGFLVLHDIKTNSNLIKFNGRFIMSLSTLRPHIELYGNFSYLNILLFKQIFPQSWQDNFSCVKNIINLMNTHDFDGVVIINIKKLISDSEKVKELTLDLVLDNGILTINSLKSKIYNGDLDIVGNIIYNDIIPRYIVGFALNNINPSEFMQDILGIDNLSGYMSINGSLSSSGKTQDTLLSRMNGSIKILGRNLYWRGFNINEIIKIHKINTSFSDIMRRLAHHTKYGYTFFDSVSGKINIVSGIAELDGVKLDNKRFKGVLIARYDIANKLINSLTKFSFIPIDYSTAIVLQVINKGKLPNTEVVFDTQSLISFLKETFNKDKNYK